MNIQLKIHHKQGSTHLINIPLKQKLAVIVAQPKGDVTFELIDLDTQLAPQPVFMKRVGNDLHIFIDDNTLVDVVITDYYTNEPLSPIMGMAEDGLLYPYLAESNLLADSIPHLSENVLAAQVLGGEGVVAAFLPFNWKPLLVGLAGLAGIGLVKALTDRGTDDSTDTPPVADDSEEETSAPSTDNNSNISSPPPSQPTLGLSQTLDANGNKTGGITIPNNPQFNRFEVEFTPEGKNKPVKIVYERQPDGSLKLVTDLDKLGLSHLTPAQLPPSSVAAGEDIQLPSDLLKDNSPVSVKGFTNSGESTANITAPYDNNVNVEISSIVGEDRNNKDGDDLYTINGKGTPGALVEIKDKNGNTIATTKVNDDGDFFVKVALDPNNPARDNLNDLTLVASKPNHNPESLPLKDVPADKITSLETKPNDAYIEPPVVKGDKLTDQEKADNNIAQESKDPVINVTVPKKDDVNTVDLVITKPNGEKETVTVGKDENGNFTKPTDPNSPIKAVIPTDDGFKAVLDGEKYPKDTNVVAVAKGEDDNTSTPSNPVQVGENGEVTEPAQDSLTPAKKPSFKADSIKAIDESLSADKNPEKVVVEGEGSEQGDFVTLYVKKGDNLIPLATVEVKNEDGSFSISASDLGRDDLDLQEGDELVLVATGVNKRPSDQSDGVKVPAVADGKEGHPYDTTPPSTPELSVKDPANLGGAKVNVPQIQPGETLVFTYKDNDGTNKTLTIPTDQNGNLVAPADLPEGVTVSSKTLTVPGKMIKDDSNVTAHIQDLAGNISSPVAEGNVGFDQKTDRPSFTADITAVDTDTPANNVPEKIKAKITGGQKGDIAKIVDDEGNVLGEVELGDPNEDGTHTVDVSVNSSNNPPKHVDITLQAPNSEPTDPVRKNVDPVPEGSEGHPNDTTNPTKPTISQSESEVVVNFNPEDTDKLELDLPTVGKVTLTKDPATGGFTSSNPAVVPNLPKGDHTVNIPRENLPKTGGEITATASDIAGNSEPADSETLKPIEKQLDKPTIESVEAIDTDPAANKNPEKFVIKGKAPEGATVIIARDTNGNEIGRVKPNDDRTFTLNVKEHPDLDIKNANEIKIVADSDAEGVFESTPINPTKTDTFSYLDTTKPAKPEPISSGKNDVSFAVPSDAEKVEVTYTPKDATEPKTVTLTRDPSGKLTSSDPNIQVGDKDEQGRDTIHLPSTVTKPNTDVTAVAVDLAGNRSEPGKDVTVDNSVPVHTPEETTQPQTDKPTISSVTTKDSNVPADGKADFITVAGQAEPNATVTVMVDGKVLGTITADASGQFSVEFNAPDNGFNADSKVSVTAKAPNKSTSQPSEEAAVPAPTVFDDTVPPAQPTLSVKPNGDVEVQLDPTDKPKVGETLTIKVKPQDPSQPERTVTLTKKEQGWTSSDEEAVPSTNNDQDPIVLKDGATPAQSEVSVTRTDLANNPSKPATANVGKDPSGKPSIDSIDAFDNSNPWDDNPESFTVKGTAPAGSTVIVRDADGKELGRGKADDKGKFEINAIEKPGGKDLNKGDKLTVEAIEEGKLPTPSEPFDIPAVASGKAGHIGDREAPSSPNVEINPATGNGEITLPTDAKVGDKVIANIVDNDTGETKTVEVEKTGEGANDWTVNTPESTVGGVTVEDGKVTIPKGSLPANGSISAVSDDGVNQSPADTATIKPHTATPTISEIKAYDTSLEADNNPEKVVIKGSVSAPDNVAGITVIARDDKGNVLGTAVTKDNGEYELVIMDKPAADGSPATSAVDLVQGSVIKVSAQAPNKLESHNNPSQTVPAVEAGKAGHIGDGQLPDAPKGTGETEDNVVEADKDLTLELPKDTHQVVLKVDPKDGEPTTVILTKQPDGSFKSSNPTLVPDVEKPAEGKKPTVTIPKDKLQPNTNVTATVKDLADNESEPTTIAITQPKTDNAAEQKVVAPTLEISTKNDEVGAIRLTLPTGTGSENTTKVVLNYIEQANGKAVKVVFSRPDGNSDNWTIEEKSDQSFNINPSPDENGGKFVLLGEPLVKDGSLVTAYSTNHNGSVVSETAKITAPVGASSGFTATPHDVTVTPVDTSDPADSTPETYRFTGKVTAQNGTQIEANTLVTIKDKQGNVIATARTDENGNFSVEVPANKQLGNDAGNTLGKVIGNVEGSELNSVIDVVAKADNKGVSPAAANVTKGDLIHSNDTTAPDAVAFSTDQAGNVTATLPANAQEGDEATFTLTPKDSNSPVTFTLVKKGDNWEPKTGTQLPADVKVTGNNVSIPASKLAGGTDEMATVSATIKDIADNARTSSTEVQFSKQPTIESIEPIDTSYYGDNNPEKLIIKGSSNGEPDGTVVVAKDEKGNIIGSGVVENGKFTIEAHEKDSGDNNINHGSKITVVATAPGKAASKPSVESTVMVDPTTLKHEEKVAPEVTLDRAEDGNTVTATVSPDTKEIKVVVGEGDDQKTVTAQRDPVTGAISDSTDESVIPNVPATDPVANPVPNTVTINSGGKPVIVTATDSAGNSSDPVENTPKAPEVALDPTGDVTINTIKAIDTSKKADNDPEKFVVTGTTEPHANVELKAPNGTVIGTATADENGHFTVTGVETPESGDIEVGHQLKVVATAPNKAPSNTAEVAVPEVEAGRAGHEGDRTPPTATIGRGEEPEAPSTGDNAANNGGNTGSNTDGNTPPAGGEGDDNNPAEGGDNAGGEGGDKPTPPVVADVIAKVSEDTDKVKVCVGDQCTTLTRQEDGTLKSDNEALVPSTKADDPNTIRIPEAVANGKEVTVTPIDKLGNEGETLVSPAVFVPKAPELTAEEDGSVTLGLPDDARVGDKVVFTYQPTATEDNPNPAREQITFTKGEDGNWTADKEGFTPTKDNATGSTTVKLPADKVADESQVTAYSENKEGTGRTEATPVETKVDNSADQPAAKTATPTELKLVALDENGDGDPDYFTLTGKVEGTSKPTTVTITDANGKELATVDVKEDGTFTAVFKDDAVNNLTQGSELKVKAKEEGKVASDEVTETVDQNEISSANPNVEFTAKPTELAVTKLEDTNNPADNNPEKFTVTGKVEGEPAGTVVTIKDEKGNVLTTATTTDASGHFTATFSENSGKDLRVGDNLIFSAKSGDKATSADVALEIPNNVKIDHPNDTKAPETPTVTANPVTGDVSVKVPNDLVVGDTLAITFTPTGATDPVTVTFEKQPDGTLKSGQPNLIPDQADGTTAVVIPANSVADNTPVKAQATDLANNASPESQDTALPSKVTHTPEATATPFDLSDKADSDPEKVVISGKVPAEQAGTKVKLYDKDGQLIGETTTDGDGNYSFTLVEPSVDQADRGDNPDKAIQRPDLKVGDSFQVIAEADGEQPSISKTVTVGEIPMYDQDSHPKDTTNPTAPNVIAGVADGKAKGDGSATVVLPHDAVEGDKVKVSFKDENDTPVTLEFVKKGDQWVNEPAATDPNGFTLNGNTLEIPEDKIKDGEKVTAVATDVAGRTAQDEGTAGKDDVATQPIVESIKAVNTSNPADNSPEKVVLQVKGKPGETVKVFKGEQEIGSKEVPNEPAGEDGLVSFPLEVTETAADVLEAGVELTLKATHTDKDDSDSTSTTVPAVSLADPKKDFNDQAVANPNAGDHDDTAKADSDAPAAPRLIASKTKGDGSVTLGLPQPDTTKEGDRIQVQFYPENAAEGDEPTVATLTKQADGTWKSDNSAIPDIPANVKEVKIPEDSLKDNTPVKARSVDPAGNTSNVVDDTAGYDEVTLQPYDVVIEPFDTNSQADSGVDVLKIMGKTEPLAVVTLTKPDGTDLGDQPITVTADAQGNFTAYVAVQGAENLDQFKTDNNITGEIPTVTTPADIAPPVQIGVKAKHPNKAESAVETQEIPRLDTNTADHPFDNQAPTAPTLKAIDKAEAAKPENTGKTRGSVELTFPTDAVEGDKVAVEFTKPDGTLARVVYQKAPTNDGNGSQWQIVEAESTPDHGLSADAIPVTDQGTTVTLPADKLKDNSPVFATSYDQAGRSSERATGTAPYENDTTLTDLKVRSEKKDPNAATQDVNPGKTTISGKTDKGATVTVEVETPTGKVKLTTTADNNGNFSVTFEEGTAPLSTQPSTDDLVVGKKITVTAKVDGKEASVDSSKTVPPTRTVFVEVSEAVDAVDVGTITAKTNAGAGDNSPQDDKQHISDKQADKITLKGWVEEKAGLTVEVYNKQGQKVASKVFAETEIGYKEPIDKTDTQNAKENSNGDKVTAGKFEVTLSADDAKLMLESGVTKATVFSEGYSVKVIANNADTNSSKGDGEVSTFESAGKPVPLTIPALQDTAADHPNDKDATKLNADPNAITLSNAGTGEADGRTHAVVKLPTESDVKKITLEFKGEDNSDQKVVWYRQEDGSWKVSTQAGENTANFADLAKTETSIAIPHDKLYGGNPAAPTVQVGQILLKVEDIAAQSETIEKTVTPDLYTTLSNVDVAEYDTSPRADDTAEKIVITGTSDNGATITLVDASGNEVKYTGSNAAITTTASVANGGTDATFSLEVDLTKLPADKRTGLKVKAKVAGKVAKDNALTIEAVTAQDPEKPEAGQQDQNAAARRHTGDETAPEITLKPNSSKVVFSLPAFEQGKKQANGTEDDPQLTALAKGDKLVLSKEDGSELATFTYDGTNWTPANGNNGIDAPVVVRKDPKDQNSPIVGYEFAVKSGQAGLAVGDKVKAKITDLAGNHQEAEGTLPDSSLIDVAEAYAGARTKVNENDVENAARLLLDASTDGDKVNSGDVWVKVGKDNNKVKLSYIAQDGATYDKASNTWSKSDLWAIKQDDGSWKVFDDENGQTESNKAEIVKLKQNGTEQDSNTPKYIISQDEDATVFIRLKESAVKDKSVVEVVSYDEDGNNTSLDTATPAKDGERIVQPLGDNPTAEQQAKYANDQEAARTVSVETDFDDATENSVSVLNATQTDGNSDIVVDTATNADFAKEVTAYVVQFDTDDNISKDDRNSLGLADPANGNAHNYLVALKVPNGDNGGTTWALGLWSGEVASLDKVNLNNTYVPNAKVASIDPQTGVITLKKEVVKGGSSVSVGTIDAYGNSATPVQGDSENPLTTKHANNENSVVVVPDPKVTPLGNGVLEVLPGNVPSKYDANNKTDTVIGSDHKTLVDVNGDGTPDITISYDPANNTWSKTGNLPNGVTEVSFDPETGKLTLNSTEAHTVKAHAELTHNNKTEKSQEISDAFMLQDTTEYAADVAEVHPQADGSVEIKPGLDNKKITVEYSTDGGARTNPPVVLEKDESTGQWSVKLPSTGSGHFDFSNGKIVLKKEHVQDGTKVTAVGYDGTTYPADYKIEDLRNQEVKADEHSGYAMVDDNDTSTAEQPSISPKDSTGKQQGNEWQGRDLEIARGGDNQRMDIRYKPRGGTSEKTLSVRLKTDGKWELVDENGVPVVEEVATVNPENGTITLKHLALEPTKDNAPQNVTAVGYNGAGKEAIQTQQVDKAPPAGGNPGETNDKPSEGQINFLSVNDGEFHIWGGGVYAGKKLLFKFKGYEVASQTTKVVVVEIDESGNKNMYLYNDEDINLPFTQEGIKKGQHTEIPTGFITNHSTSGRYIVKSTEHLRLIADSVNEPDINNSTHDDLKVRAWGFVDQAAQAKKTKPNQQADVASMYLRNTAVTPKPSLDKTKQMPEVMAIDGNNADENKGTGAVKITPKTEHNQLYVRYTKESGQEVAAVLKKQGGNWTVTYGDSSDFHIENKEIYIKPNSLKDEQKDGVVVRGVETGKLPSDEAKATPKTDVVPDPVGDPEIFTGLSEATEENYFALKVGDDVHVRQGLIIRKNIKESSGFTALKKAIEEGGKGTVTIDATYTEDAIAGSSRPTVVINLVKQGTQPSDGAKLLIDGSLGETTAAYLTQLSGPMLDMYISMESGNVNDLIVIRNDLGEDDTKGQRTIVDMGHGHNVLSVGSALEHFVLYEDTQARTAADRYRYFHKDATPNGSWQKVEVLEHGKSGFAGLSSSVGGRVMNTTVRMGDGNDLLVLEGASYNDHYIIGKNSNIQMGAGNDAIIGTEASKDNKVMPNRGVMGDSSINMGDGNDFLKLVGLSSGARVEMGSGDDTAEFTRITSNARLNMGSGNDKVLVTGEVRDWAEIFLGSGDDVFEFGLPVPRANDPLAENSRTILWGSLGKRSLFEGSLDGGDGYDVIKLYDTQREGSYNAISGHKTTNLNTRNFKGIEEIQLEQNTVVDIRYEDLLNDGVNGPLKITAFNGDLSTSGGARYVDLGGHELNNNGSTPINGTGADGGKDIDNDNRRWVKSGTQESGGKTFGVYTYGNDHSNAVWVEESVNIIVI